MATKLALPRQGAHDLFNTRGLCRPFIEMMSYGESMAYSQNVMTIKVSNKHSYHVIDVCSNPLIGSRT